MGITIQKGTFTTVSIDQTPFLNHHPPVSHEKEKNNNKNYPTKNSASDGNG